MFSCFFFVERQNSPLANYQHLNQHIWVGGLLNLLTKQTQEHLNYLPAGLTGSVLSLCQVDCCVVEGGGTACCDSLEADRFCM